MKKPKTYHIKKPLTALASGITGALALTLTHETIRRYNPQAPRMDVLGMRAIARIMYHLNKRPPEEDKLFKYSMIGDIVSNSLYYTLVGTGRRTWWRGTTLGLAAGIGGVVLPGPLGLGEEPSGRTTETKFLTIGLYLVGGLVAAAMSRALVGKPSPEELDKDDVAVV